MSHVFASDGIIANTQKEVNVRESGFQCKYTYFKIFRSSGCKMFSE